MPTISLTSRTVSLIWPKPGLGGAAALDAGLDLGGDGAGLAGQLADRQRDLAGRRAGVVGELLHFGGDDREAAAGIPGAGRFDGRIEREHVGLAGDGLDRRGDGLDLVHRRSEAGHALAQLDDQLGQALEAGDGAFDRAAAGVELGLGLLGQQPRFVGRIADPRLVGEQPRGHFLEPVEHFQMLGDPVGDLFDIAGDVAALDRQRAAIARHRANGVFGNLFDA